MKELLAPLFILFVIANVVAFEQGTENKWQLGSCNDPKKSLEFFVPAFDLGCYVTKAFGEE